MRGALYLVLVSAYVLVFGVTGIAIAQEPVEEEASEPAMDGLLGGDSQWEMAYDRALLEGRDFYNAEALDEAKDAFTRAIQIMPQQAAAYRNLARTYHWLGAYPEATAFYDHYLRLAPEAEEGEAIRQERRSASSRSGDELWTLPGNQRMAHRSLERELDDGSGITPGGGGAWGLYQTLLRMGYAAPDLASLRQRLEQKIWAEFEERFIADESFLPVLRSSAWELQRERLSALTELAREPARLESIEARILVVDAAEALLGGRYQRAADRAEEAAQVNPDLRYVGWYRVVALEQARRPQEALEALEALIEADIFDDESARRVEVLRAQILQQVGRGEEAAQIYRKILGASAN